jgi:hypothetical protein
MILMAPVEYIPAATIKRAPTVRTPEFENPVKLALSGASPSVTLIVKAPRKIATGGILVNSSNPKVAIRTATVSQASYVIRFLPYRELVASRPFRSFSLAG